MSKSVAGNKVSQARDRQGCRKSANASDRKFSSKAFDPARFVCAVCMAILCLAFAGGVFAQVQTSGTLTGTVLDPQGAAIVGAAVAVTDQATNSTVNAQTRADGHFEVANLNAGTYTVTVTMAGFKKGVYHDLKIVSAQTYDLSAKLELGEVNSTVTVEAGQQVIETTDTSVNNTVTGRTIQQLPFTSRDTLDLAVLDPNTQSDGRPRNSTVAGLPQGALNITFDGLNVQDTDLKSGDGFYTYIRPRVDDVEEFTMTTAANDASKSFEGAVQIGFVSKRGGNEWHGGVWEYNRNDDFNANYYFNNLAGTPRQVERLNEYGGKVGGPIWKNHVWFFIDTDHYSFPQSLTVSPSVLTAQASAGIYAYEPVDANGNFLAPTPTQLAATPWITCNNAAQTCNANLLQLAANQGNPATIDAAMQPILNALQTATTAPGVSILPNNLYSNTLSFLDKATNSRWFPDVRIDADVSKRDHVEADEHWSNWVGNPDFLNGGEATFPVAPFNSIQGGQNGFRYETVLAWTHTIGTSASNELRAGVVGGPQGFSIGQDFSQYPKFSTNLGNLTVIPNLFGGLVSEPFLQTQPQGRNYATGQANDTLSWTKGTHNLSFGVTTTYVHANSYNDFTQNGTITLGFDNNDPAAGMFENCPSGGGNCFLPGVSESDLGNTEQLYSSLVGLITSYTSNVALNPATRQFQTGQAFVTAERQFDLGFFASDSWRMRPNFTVNYGLLWEYNGVPWDADNEYFMVPGGLAGAFDVSGQGNLFKPGVMTGTAVSYVNDKGKSWYHRDLHDFGPSVGFAWQPSFENGFLKRVTGESGRTVVRAGYSIQYTREGLANFESLSQGNPGFTGSQLANSSAQFDAQSLTYAGGQITGAVQTPTSFVSSFGVDPTDGTAANVISPNLRTPMVQSYTLGIQRQIGNNMALEVRYQGNHGTRLWRQYNINEVNIFENGFLAEFTKAQGNLSVCQTNQVACMTAQQTAGIAAPTPNSFADWGLNGQQVLPIMTASFTGSSNPLPGSCATANQCSSLFHNGTLVSEITNGLAGSFANLMAVSTGLLFNENLQNAGYPSNFWLVAPTVAEGGSFILDNGAASHYNALVIDFRQRPTRGLMFDFSYTYSKSMWDQSFSADTVNTSPISAFSDYYTLRNPSLNSGVAPYDLRHQFKSQVLYELPMGPGHRFTSSNGGINRILGGWQISLLTRASSGRPTFIQGGLGGTVNQYDGGVVFNGTSANQVNSETGVTHGPGEVFWLPQSLISGSGRANPAVLAPCATAGSFCQNAFVITGPDFFRADWSLAKHTKITEKIELELRADMLNAFNNPNFLYGGSASTSSATKTLQSTTFGRITSAYQDISTTDDPGGRILQLVARINF